MKKRITLVLAALMLLSGCGKNGANTLSPLEETDSEALTELSETGEVENVIIKDAPVAVSGVNIVDTSKSSSPEKKKSEEKKKEESTKISSYTRKEKADGNYIIILDPGHQAKENDEKEASAPGSDIMKRKATAGVIGASTGQKEYELNLTVATALRKELESRGYTVYMTRTVNAVDMSNQERTKYATKKEADCLIHIHADGIEDEKINGACALVPTEDNKYVAELSKESTNLGYYLVNAYSEATGIKNRGVLSGDDMTGINFSTIPVVTFEMGFLTNEKDDENMADADFQKKMVKGLADGVDDYFHK